MFVFSIYFNIFDFHVVVFLSIHNLLMGQQQKQLDSLREWLTATEDRISHMSDVGPDLAALKSQLETHKELQQDLQNQQKVVDAVCNLVVVVDDNASDNGKF